MKKNIAVITGAGSGLGREYAKILVQEQGIDEIWAIARDLRKLDQIKSDLGEKNRAVYPGSFNAV